MEQFYMQAWQTAIMKMQDEVSPFVFDAWYRDLLPIDFVDHRYVVEVNNDTMLLGLTKQGFGESLLHWVKIALGDRSGGHPVSEQRGCGAFPHAHGVDQGKHDEFCGAIERGAF